MSAKFTSLYIGSALLLAVLGAQAQMIDSNTPAGVMPVSGGTDWVLDFSDEFTGTSLDTTKWGVDVSTKSRAARTDRGIDDWWWVSDNVSLDGAGNLKLDVTKHDANTMYCGSISSDGKYEPKYGYLEARIQIADTTKDTHTAFWLQGSNMGNVDGTGNDGAEVDIFESAWTDDYTKSVVHIDGYGADHVASTKQYSTPNLHSGFHVFGLEWTADYMKIYYDGELKVTYTGSWVPRVQEWLWLSCGASFGDIGTFQSEPNGYLTSAYVDYVRVWKAPPDNTPPSVSSLSPVDEATAVIAGSDLILNFDESIVAGSGLITIKNLTDAMQSTIDITDSSQVSINYQQLTINPTDDLLAGKQYAIQIAATALDDLVGNSFAGITDDASWNFTVATGHEPLVLVGGAVNNGNFNANPGTSVTFSATNVWYNTNGNQTQVATKSNSDYDGSQNATLHAGRGFGVNTGYAMVEGHDYDISYVWKDDYLWDDGTGTVTVSLFVTDDNTITGVRTNLASHTSGTSSANATYEAVDQDALYTAQASDAGKILFAAIETSSAGFARLDNFELVAYPPSLFEIWADTHSLGGLSGPGDNPDLDQFSNLQEFAFGMDPTSSAGLPLAFAMGGDVTQAGSPILMNFAAQGEAPDLRAVFLRREDHVVAGLVYTLDFSADLAQWTTSEEVPTRLTDPGSPNGLEAVSVPYPALVPANGGSESLPPQFFRVGVGMP